MAKDKSVSTVVSDATLAELKDSYPIEPAMQRIQLPRISMASQDKTKETGTGKNKKIEVVTAAGTFFTETETKEEDEETGKKIWKKEEIGDTFEGIILYQRKQLRMFDDEVYTSSPIYDIDEEVIPLWCDRQEVARGTPAELKAKYQYKDPKSGKAKSKLEDNRVLYVKNMKDDKIYQLALRGTSMYSFFTYGRKVLVPSVVTTFGSEPKENGAISWNQMTFKVSRKLNQEEADQVLDVVREIRDTISAEKAQFGGNQPTIEADVQMVELAGDSKKSSF